MSIWHFCFSHAILKHCSCNSLTEVAEALSTQKHIAIIHHQSFEPAYIEHIHCFVQYLTLPHQNLQRVKKCLLNSKFGQFVTNTHTFNEFLKSVRSEITEKNQKQFLNSLLYGTRVPQQILATNNIQLLVADASYSKFLKLIYSKGCPSYHGNLKPCSDLFSNKVLKAAGFFAGHEQLDDDEEHLEDLEDSEQNQNNNDLSLTSSENKASKKYDYLQSVIESTKSENLTQLQKRLTPEQYKELFIYAGVNWKSYLGILFEANSYSILKFENTLSYVEKLQHRFQDRLVLAQKNGSLHDGVGWLHQFLSSNKINVSNFKKKTNIINYSPEQN